MDKGQHGRYYTQPNVHEINANPVHPFGAAGVQQNPSTLAGHNLQSLPNMAAAQQLQQSSAQQQQMAHTARNFIPQHSGHRQRHPGPAFIQQRQQANVLQHNPTMNSQPGAMMQGYFPPQYVVPQQMVQGIHRQYAPQQTGAYQVVYYPGAPPYMIGPLSTAPQMNQQTQSVPVRTSAQMGLGTQNSGGYVQMNQPSQQYIASTETTAQSTEPVTQYPQPTPAAPRPLEKRERKGAVIADPTTGRVFTEQELQSKAPLQQPDTKSDPNPSSDASSPRNPSVQGASTDAALEFRDKVSSLALGTAGKESAENHTTGVVTTEEAEVETAAVTKSDADISEVVDGSCVGKPVSESDKLDATDIDVVEAGVDINSEISATNDTCAKIDDCAAPLNSVSDVETERTLPEVTPASVPGEVEPISDSTPVAENGTSVAAEENKPTTNTLPSASTSVTSEISVEQNTSQESKELNDSQTLKSIEKMCIPLSKDKNSESTPETVVVETSATNDTELNVVSATIVEAKTVDNDSVAETVLKQDSDDEKQMAKPKVDVKKADFSSQLSKDELETKKGGKLEYSLDFLKSLQSAPESLRKPHTLPKLDIVHDIPVPQREPIERGGYNRHSSAHQGMGPQDMFLPHYLHTAPRSQTRSASQRSNQNRPSQQDRPRKIISPSLTQDVKLHTVDNAWKPQGKQTDANDEEAKTAELMKAFRGILNKLTPQKYMKLLEDVKKLTIDTEERLQGILELIFDKAVDEPAFCLQYANLCKHLAYSLKAVNITNEENGVGKELRFTPLLLTRCQKEFESKMYEGIDVEGKQAIIDETTDEEKKKLLRAELDEEKRKARKRSLGNIKLIGELYLLGMLKANIMMSCVERLLRDSEEESLECLCTLLRTIGSKLESDVKEFENKKGFKKDSLLSPYFSALIDYVNEKKTSARVRFMIQDVLDMRQNGWKARKIQDENKPKTIDEIHSEAQEEEKKQMVQLQHHSQQKRQESMKKSGDWKNKNSKDVNMMLKNLKNTSTEHGNMQFGPGNFGGLWSQGARGGSQQKQESQMSSSRQMQTKPTIQQRDSAKGPSRNSSSHHSDMARKGDAGFGSQEGEQWIRKHPAFGRNAGPPPFGNDVIVRTRDNRDSRNSSMEKGSAPSSRGGSMKRESQKPVVEITREEIERRSMAAVKEYLGNNNSKEGIAEDIQSFCNDTNFNLFVATAVNHALDVSSHQHQLSVGELLTHIYLKKIFNRDQVFAGLDDILQVADDIVVDVPKFFDYMGNILSPFYVNLDDSSRKLFFVTALKSCTANGCGAKLMCHVLKSACQSTHQNKVGSLWRSGGFNWCEFISADEEQEFIEKNELQFTVNPSTDDGDNQRLNDSKLIDREMFFANITRKVQTSCSNSNEELLELIEKSFETNEEKTDPNFVSALVKAVVYGCVNSNKVNGDTSYSVDQKRLETKCAILAKYCDNDEERETKCLYALQQLAEELEHPSKLLNSIFTTLHDQNVISSEAFLQWESTASASQGKAVAVLTVKQFLTWLKEPEDYSDS